MASADTKQFSRSGIEAMKAKGEVRATPADAPEIELAEVFWQRTRIVETHPRRKASVHLRLDADTLNFYRAAGRGHLIRMANIPRAYAEAQAEARRR